MRKLFFIFTLALLSAVSAEAKLQLPQLFQSGMVLQRGKPVPLWGWAAAGERLTVELVATTSKKPRRVFLTETTAGADGRWQVMLPQQKAGGPFTVVINSENATTGESVTVNINDVLFGDVWLCSGQSNIDVTIERVYPQYTTDIDSYSNDNIRLFRVQNETSINRQKSDILPTAINWKPLNKQNAWRFSAVGYFLGKRMHELTGVPQGVIVNSWGGTPIEAWVAADSLRRDFPTLLAKTELYASEAFVNAQRQANSLANQRWNELLAQHDPGISGQWMAADLDDSQWTVTDQYAPLLPGRNFTGTLWLRQHIQIDKAHAGQPARLLLGTLFDADQTFVNGKQVGTTGYQYPPRRYDLPEGLLREGDNVITIRFINRQGMPHFIKEKPYLLAFGDDRFSQNPLPADVIPLSGKWRLHIGTEMPACPQGDVSLQNLPTTLYNAVVAPLAPYALSGVVWYQGESNAGNPAPYHTLLTRLITGWRQLWQQPSLPFTVVQLANFMQPADGPQSNSGWARLREAQRLVAKELPAVELATAIDLGETVDIHPLRKRELSDRIARCFQRTVLGQKVLLSPELVTATSSDATVTLTFDQPLADGALHEFELAGSDGRFHNAEATAHGNTVTISCPAVTAPQRVRHAWKDNPIRLNARAADTGLPLPPFEAEVTAKH